MIHVQPESFMSYLDRLRLHFAGRFQATMSTVNNDPRHFDNASFKLEYQLRQTDEDANGGWNPDGNGAWRLVGCRVTSAFHADGTAVALSDAILQMFVADSDRKAPAKIVDLDPQQQFVSTLFGLEIRITDQAGNSLLRGRFEPAACDDIWPRIQGSGPSGDGGAGAIWQSVLTELAWGDLSESCFLQELRAVAPDRLSIKLNVDRYSMEFQSDLFCTGRVVGTLGPAHPDEPAHLVIGRQFLAQFSASGSFLPAGKINNCVGVLDEAAGSCGSTSETRCRPRTSVTCSTTSAPSRAPACGPTPTATPSASRSAASIIAFQAGTSRRLAWSNCRPNVGSPRTSWRS
ncbi:hypothetical protein [Nannocystis pusilla]|uniref:hypothetical protein n=1 Tax=Nannocystis pusilla TaxID=889268 RepID=UPI003B7F0401